MTEQRNVGPTKTCASMLFGNVEKGNFTDISTIDIILSEII